MPQVELPYFDHVPFYAYLIRINNNTVGSIQKVSINSERQEVQRIREIGNSRGAEIKEFVWGGVNTTLDLERIEMYSSSLMGVLGYKGFYSLEDFNFTFDIQELIYKAPQDRNPAFNGSPISINKLSEGFSSNISDISRSSSLLRNISYKDCIPTRWTKTIDRNTVQVIETMQVYCRKIKVTSYSANFNPES
jgi:hypothetical protein